MVHLQTKIVRKQTKIEEWKYVSIEKNMEQLFRDDFKVEFLYREWSKKFGIGYYAMLILFAISRSDACTQKEISEQWLLPKQTVNAAVKEFQKKGYIQLTPGRNQKEKPVSFTEEGKVLAHQILEEGFMLEKRILERMGADAVTQYALLNKQYADILEEEIKQSRE